MPKWLISGLCGVVIAGCAAGVSLDERLAALKGQSEASVVDRLGYPDGVYEAGGKRVLTYTDVRTYPTFDSFDYYGHFHRYPDEVRFCRIQVIFTGDAMTGYRYEGNGCY